MRLRTPSCPFHRAARRGTAILVVMVLLACMALLIAANTSTLHTLTQELRALDHEQLKKYAPTAPHP